MGEDAGMARETRLKRKERPKESDVGIDIEKVSEKQRGSRDILIQAHYPCPYKTHNHHIKITRSMAQKERVTQSRINQYLDRIRPRL